MEKTLNSALALIQELDRLKTVKRRAYVAKGLRQENSAEHSWHLATSLWSLSNLAPDGFRLERAIELALIHDLGEIDPGDTSVFSKRHQNKREAEEKCIERLGELYPQKASQLKNLWLEYEEQTSLEAQWVRAIDRLLPFLLNRASEGKAWLEQDIHHDQVLEINQATQELFPELYEWIKREVQVATKQGWLK